MQRFIGVAVVAIVIAVLPRFVPAYTAFELTYVGAYAIAILGLVVLTGMSGQISLGHGAFLAIGGYTVAILAHNLGVPYWVSIPLAAIACGAFGVLIGLVALRLEGVYLALATFSLAVATPSILKHFTSLTGGVGGLQLPSFGAPAAFEEAVTPERWLYYATWIIVAITFLATSLLLAGSVGRSLRALRDNEIAAVSFGVNPYFYKTLAFGWSAALAGVGGAIVAIATAYISPDIFGLTLSITLLVGAVLGGIDSLWGALVGGFVIEFLPLWAQNISPAAPSVVYGIALILVMIFMPGGIVGTLRRLVPRGEPLAANGSASQAVPSTPAPVAVKQSSRD